MKILILEDDSSKLEAIESHIAGLSDKVNLFTCVSFQQFNSFVERERFDLIIVDLIVPVFDGDKDAVDVADRVVRLAHDVECLNKSTPIVALTKYDYAAEDNYRALNGQGVSIITYDEKGDWRKTLTDKFFASMPDPTYDAIIVCALKKEAKAFEDAGYSVGPVHTQYGIECREIAIGSFAGLIVSASRMGLVGAAIATARAIDAFKPKIVCMSGICAGIAGEANIYDVIITKICQQHDYGKWTSAGFQPEHYAVQLNHGLELKIEAAIEDPSFKMKVAANMRLKKSEFPEGKEELDFDIFTAPTSSGNAVIADEVMANMIKGQRRKAAAFEMEAFAVYEASRMAVGEPLFFCAKSVVDDGSQSKGDNFHRAAAILSAKTVYQIIEQVL